MHLVSVWKERTKVERRQQRLDWCPYSLLHTHMQHQHVESLTRVHRPRQLHLTSLQQPAHPFVPVCPRSPNLSSLPHPFHPFVHACSCPAHPHPCLFLPSHTAVCARAMQQRAQDTNRLPCRREPRCTERGLTKLDGDAPTAPPSNMELT